MARHALAAAAAAAALLAAVPAMSRAEGPSRPGTSVFDMPFISAEIANAAALARAGDVAEAFAKLTGLAAAHPDRPEPLASRALVLAQSGQSEPALEDLTAAVDAGLRDLRLYARTSLAGLPAYEALVARAAALGPARDPLAEAAPGPIDIEGQRAPVTDANTRWDPVSRRFEAGFLIPPVLARRPVMAADGPLRAVAPFINRWYAEGRAAGLAGVLYDNRDRRHSAIARRLLPQLLHTDYSAEAMARGVDYGPNRRLEFDAITFGNSSTAVVRGPYWRSQFRRVLTEPKGPDRLFRHYSRNHIYVYPSKDDYGKRGDLFPANTPYAIVSRGASYSDQPFLYAIAAALAALQPDTAERMAEAGLVAPTLQRLLRRSQTHVPDEAAYLTARAHPSVFDPAALDLPTLVKRAQAMGPEDIPPMVRLTVLHETPAAEVSRVMAAGLSERLADTPSAIARVHRRLSGDREMLVSARATRDPAGRPLRFVWQVLRGDASRVVIAPESEDASVVRITVPWHAPFDVPGEQGLRTSRVDIAAFAVTGAGHSAPAFVSVLFPPNQTRRIGPDGRVLEIDHRAPADAPHADPLLFPDRAWRDSFHYDDDGRLTGWTRWIGGATEAFTDRGERVLARDDDGRPVLAEALTYTRRGRTAEGRVRLVPEPTGERIAISYENGVPVRRPVGQE